MKYKGLLIKVILLILVLAALAFPAAARMSDEEKNRDIDLIIEKSGIRDQLAGLPDMVQQQALATVGSNNQQLAEILKENFTVDDLLAEVKQVFLHDFNESHTKATVNFLESDLAAKMAQYEIESLEPAFAEKRNGFDINNYNSKRRQIITKFFEEIRAQNFYYVLQSSIMEGMLQAINNLLPEEARISNAQIAKIKQQLKEQIFSDQAKEAMISDYYLTYDRATDAEIESYTKFNASGPGRWMNQCIETGIVNGMHKCAGKMILAVIAFAQSSQEEGQDGELEENDENIRNAY